MNIRGNRAKVVLVYHDWKEPVDLFTSDNQYCDLILINFIVNQHQTAYIATYVHR